jgi:hypothetical protein
LDSEEVQSFVDILQCVVGKFSVKYLCIPLHSDRLKREDLQPPIENLLKMITGWRGKLLSSAPKRTLMQACMSSIPSIPIDILSFFNFPKWAFHLIDSQSANCMWSDEEGIIRITCLIGHLV